MAYQVEAPCVQRPVIYGGWPIILSARNAERARTRRRLWTGVADGTFSRCATTDFPTRLCARLASARIIHLATGAAAAAKINNNFRDNAVNYGFEAATDFSHSPSVPDQSYSPAWADIPVPERTYASRIEADRDIVDLERSLEDPSAKISRKSLKSSENFQSWVFGSFILIVGILNI